MARVLVVEDNADNLALMSYLLKAGGHEVLKARDGIEGVQTAASEKPDLILMDLHMPGRDGYEATGLIREDDPDAPPIIAVSAYAMVGDRNRILASGFDGYMAKPIDPARFLDEVSTYLQHGQATA